MIREFLRLMCGPTAALIAAAVVSSAAAADLSLPKASGWTVWQAEQAQQQGAWRTGGPSATGEHYLQPEEQGGALEFPFESDKPVTLRVKPIWWPTGEQKLARRFPYPLVRQAGPEALDYVGNTLFASAPASGRVLMIDARSEKVMGFVAVGGYVADLVADRDRGKVYAADALGDRVAVIDAATATLTKSIPVPGGPWSLALDRGTLYVACKEAGRLVALDPMEGKTRREVALPGEPIGLELVGSPPTGLIVRFQQQAYGAFSLAPAPADEQQFAVSEPEQAEPHRLRIEGEQGPLSVDVSAVTGGPEPDERLQRFGSDPGPSHVLALDVGSPPVHLIFFLSPSHGRLGIYNPSTKSLDSIEIGGYLTDLSLDSGFLDIEYAHHVDTSMLYIVDAAGGRVVAFNPRNREVEAQFEVTGTPWRAASITEVAWQRTYAQALGGSWQLNQGAKVTWPATPVHRLYVGCVNPNVLTVIDRDSHQVVGRVPLSGEPGAVKQVPMPDADWWPLLADDRIALALLPRVAVALRPLMIDLETLRVSPAPRITAEAVTRRNSVSVPGASQDGGTKAFSASNTLTLSVDGKRAVDLSMVADPQRLPSTPLTAKEAPGSVTVSLDDGPEYDWAAGVWEAPDSALFLVNDSEEFWRYNAPMLKAGPGRHVLKITAHSQLARLQAVALSRSPELEVTLTPEPAVIHGQVPLSSYQGVFYDQEPIEFMLRIHNRSSAAIPARVSTTLRNYMGEVSESRGPGAVGVRAGETHSQLLRFSPRETGRFTLTVTVDTPDGQVTEEMHLLRLPKLEHPRLFYRKADIPAIKARIARYPTLFRRYGEWIERTRQKDEGLLPPAPSPGRCMSSARVLGATQKPVPDMMFFMLMGWPLVTTEFATDILDLGEAKNLQARFDRLLADEQISGQANPTEGLSHYHGLPFTGPEAVVLDLASEETRRSLRLSRYMASRAGDMDVMSWTLMTIEEPLTPRSRALLYRIAALESNAERYFETHHGSRGGSWWMSPFTGCNCPMNSYTTTFLYLHNVFGEPRLFEKPFFADYFTFQRYVEPLRDNRGLQPSRGGPNGRPWHWILASLCRQPLDNSTSCADEWVRRMEGPLPGDERAAVDELMAQEIVPQPLPAKALNGPIQADSLPLALALGWYDPKTPKVKLEEMPPTAAFDAEGWVPMRSGWDPQATEVTFASGLRDQTTRSKPNHFTIVKGGEYLIGTPALLPDDGNPTPAWGNSVVIGNEWPQQWALNTQHPRDQEYLLVNRFSKATFDYLERDRQMFGYQAPEGGYGGGLDLHGHTETLFMKEGRLLAYQTWPELDYVAGDATNAWPADQASQVDRQMIFLRPDLVVIYDRVKLGPAGHNSQWVATTGPDLTTHGDEFTVRSGSESLRGRALLPEGPMLATPEPMQLGWVWKDQKLLTITPARQTDAAEYLVVMRVGGGETPLPPMQLLHDERSAGVALTIEGRALEVRFNRSGPVGGSARVSENGATDSYQFREAVDNSYRNWRDDPRYESWTKEAKFSFLRPTSR